MNHKHALYRVESEYIFKRHLTTRLMEAYCIISDKIVVDMSKGLNHGKQEIENRSTLCSSIGGQAEEGRNN